MGGAMNRLKIILWFLHVAFGLFGSLVFFVGLYAGDDEIRRSCGSAFLMSFMAGYYAQSIEVCDLRQRRAGNGWSTR
jgi:hypothetical protein